MAASGNKGDKICQLPEVSGAISKKADAFRVAPAPIGGHLLADGASLGSEAINPLYDPIGSCVAPARYTPKAPQLHL